MATFPSYKPSYELLKSSAPRIRSVQFGDGFSQRVTFGLNTNPKEWRLKFDLKPADADVIEAFLDARALDAASFGWTPPNSTTELRWICPGWDRTEDGPRGSVITCTFRQVFEP